MKIDIPRPLFEELKQKLAAAREKKEDFDKTIWGRLYNVLCQHRVTGPSPKKDSNRSRKIAADRFKSR